MERVEMVKILVDTGANIDLENNDGKTGFALLGRYLFVIVVTFINMFIV